MFNLIKAIVNSKIQTKRIDTIGGTGFRGELTCQPNECEGCGKCAEICPTKAIDFSEHSIPKIDYKKCVFCGRCVDACDVLALRHTSLDVTPQSTDDSIVTIGRVIRKKMGRSLHVRHLDSGSCNACDFEMGALSNPLYDFHRYGIAFTPSPRHADLLMVTGVVTRNLEEALHMAYDAMEEPKIVMAVGACGSSGGIFGESYAIAGPLDKILPVDIVVPGCPPRPAALMLALVAAADLYGEKKNPKTLRRKLREDKEK